MNEFLLRKVKAAIQENPQAFTMDSWDCGTRACIAGWALRLAGVSAPALGPWSTFNEGRKILKLSEEQAFKLFYENNWPMEVYSWRQKFEGTETRAEWKARLAARRIDIFINSDGTI